MLKEIKIYETVNTSSLVWLLCRLENPGSFFSCWIAKLCFRRSVSWEITETPLPILSDISEQTLFSSLRFSLPTTPAHHQPWKIVSSCFLLLIPGRHVFVRKVSHSRVSVVFCFNWPLVSLSAFLRWLLSQLPQSPFSQHKRKPKGTHGLYLQLHFPPILDKPTPSSLFPSFPPQKVRESLNFPLPK